jgi:hypothetical protein
MDGFGDDHGPEGFEFMFARCEAIAAFISAFSQKNIAPKCLIHIRSGIGFGGNYHDYPQELKRVLLENKGGLPAFMFFDSMGSSGEYGDCLDLVKKYQLVERWGYPDGGHLTLAKLIAPDGNQNGQGVKQNDAEAKKWYQLAADQGHAEARRDLEWMCENGRG